MITLQLVRTLARIISAITPHWKGLEKIKTAPLVLTGPGNQQRWTTFNLMNFKL